MHKSNVHISAMRRTSPVLMARFIVGGKPYLGMTGGGHAEHLTHVTTDRVFAVNHGGQLVPVNAPSSVAIPSTHGDPVTGFARLSVGLTHAIQPSDAKLTVDLPRIGAAFKAAGFAEFPDPRRYAPHLAQDLAFTTSCALDAAAFPKTHSNFKLESGRAIELSMDFHLVSGLHGDAEEADGIHTSWSGDEHGLRMETAPGAIAKPFFLRTLVIGFTGAHDIHVDEATALAGALHDGLTKLLEV